MILYKVTQESGRISIDGNNGFEVLFIIAENQAKAIQKYLKIVNISGLDVLISAKAICMRDSIIPTVEPTKEFQNAPSK